jgi:hypothetical protein
MSIKIAEHVKNVSTFAAPVQAAARELPAPVAALLRRLELQPPAPNHKLKIRDVDAAMIKANMLTAARVRAKSELAFYGLIAA